MRYIDIADEHLSGNLRFEKPSRVGNEYIEHFQIIFQQVCGLVTCWEVVVHHLRPVFGVMDGVLSQTHRGT